MSVVVEKSYGMGKGQERGGFTLIELSLSIAFISILSIIIVVIINNTISSYRRGLTLNRINSVGMDLIDDLRAATQNSSAKSVTESCSLYYDGGSDGYEKCMEDGARNFVSVVRLAPVKVGGKHIGDSIPVFGAYCTGSYSYIWNSGYFFSESGKGGDYEVVGTNYATLKYKLDDSVRTMEGENGRPFKLLKIQDNNRSVCISAVNGKDVLNSTSEPTLARYSVERVGSQSAYERINNIFDISSILLDEEPIDLLANDQNNDLAVYNLSSATPAESKSNNRLFYAVSMVLGTIQGGVNVNDQGNFCATPNDYTNTENLDYCAINKFNFATQATGV